jgi:hypothetical protein
MDDVTRIKTYRKPHTWVITDASPLEDAPEFTLTKAICSTCLETASFTAAVAKFLSLRRWGCAREGFTGRFEREDLVIAQGGRLDYFVDYAHGGAQAVTSNIGGGTYVVRIADLKPAHPKQHLSCGAS